MPSSYTNPVYPYTHSPDQDSAQPVHHPVVIVGGGPAGLAAAMDRAPRLGEHTEEIRATLR